MKRKIIAMVLACTMLLSSGCSANVAMDENGKITVDGVPIEELAKEYGDILGKQDEQQEEGDEEAVEDAAEDEESLVIEGGSPWIDSDLKGNIKEDMELSPKDDFHLYKNYDWLLKAEIPEGRSSESSFSNVYDQIEEKALALLTDDSLKGHDAELVQTYYNAILDWDERDKAGLDPIMDMVKNIQEISSLDELSELICDPDKPQYLPAFIGMGNVPSYDDPESYITVIAGEGFNLEDAAEYKKRTEYGDRYYESRLNLSKAILTRLGYSEEDAGEMFDTVIDLESKLAEVALTSADYMATDHVDKTNNVYEPDELKDFSKSFPLKDFIKGMGYEEAERFMVREPALMERLDEIYTEDNLEALKDYVLIGYVINIADVLDSEAYDAYVESYNTITGSTGREKDEIMAYDSVRGSLSVPMDRTYLERYDSTEKKERITKICEDIIDAYRKMLKKEDWLSEETREMAIEKLDAITINAVYPEKWEDYSSLDLKGLSLFDCNEEIAKYIRKLDIAKTNGKVDYEIWDLDILEANAFYNPQDNSINIILGILEKPFYYDGMSDEELYGGIGAAIGHEISHAFDTNGAQYDKDGNYKNWWKDEDYEAFKDRADKLIKYYDTITVWEGQNVIGTNLQTEAIADMAGIKALLLIAEDSDDFDYDKFFASFARTWRRISTREYDYLCLTQDVHPLSYLRTNVSLQQFNEFYDTYDIKEGDNMYLAPENRISVW